MSRIKNEPVFILGTTEAAINAVQVAAIPMPTWSHTLIAAGSIFIGTVLARMQVTPTAKVPADPSNPYS